MTVTERSARFLKYAGTVGLGLAVCMAVISHVLAVGTAISEDAQMDIANGWIMAEQFAFHVPQFLGVVVLVSGRLTLNRFLMCVILAYVFNELGVFSERLHGFLEVNHFYPDAFYHGNQSVNVQYAILIFYAALAPLLCIRISLKKIRTIDTVFVTLIFFTMIGTTFIFHKIIVENALKTAIEDTRYNRMQSMQLISNLPTGDAFSRLFQDSCNKIDVSCFVLNPGEPLPAGKRYSEMLLEMARSVQRDTGNKQVFFSQSLYVGGLEEEMYGEQYVFRRLPDETVRFIVDTQDYGMIPAEYKPYFAILMLCAHIWWVGGGTALLFWHKRRFKGRQRLYTTSEPVH
ncbi:hypothetical protein [Thalassospira xiamenensis]|uniref:Uncharacterized protein n=1 Tax=Thalassospira xiamenensis TaxID=220697 RepID=A0A285TTQ7_9PROT|nr:hypothetical protein [Thalassospira xiamenensis]SOC27206.1 hypothetical protein SAMN05428964_105305 [Thalassospira xiamenensis]